MACRSISNRMCKLQIVNELIPYYIWPSDRMFATHLMQFMHGVGSIGCTVIHPFVVDFTLVMRPGRDSLMSCFHVSCLFFVGDSVKY